MLSEREEEPPEQAVARTSLETTCRPRCRGSWRPILSQAGSSRHRWKEPGERVMEEQPLWVPGLAETGPQVHATTYRPMYRDSWHPILSRADSSPQHSSRQVQEQVQVQEAFPTWVPGYWLVRGAVRTLLETTCRPKYRDSWHPTLSRVDSNPPYLSRQGQALPPWVPGYWLVRETVRTLLETTCRPKYRDSWHPTLSRVGSSPQCWLEGQALAHSREALVQGVLSAPIHWVLGSCWTTRAPACPSSPRLEPEDPLHSPSEGATEYPSDRTEWDRAEQEYTWPSWDGAGDLALAGDWLPWLWMPPNLGSWTSTRSPDYPSSPPGLALPSQLPSEELLGPPIP